MGDADQALQQALGGPDGEDDTDDKDDRGAMYHAPRTTAFLRGLFHGNGDPRLALGRTGPSASR